MDIHQPCLPSVHQSSKQHPDILRLRSAIEDELLPHMLPRIDNAEAEPTTATADEGVEYLGLDQVGVETWIEAQLLDCLNLARQHGLRLVAAALDRALDLLAEEAAIRPASLDATAQESILRFRPR